MTTAEYDKFFKAARKTAEVSPKSLPHRRLSINTQLEKELKPQNKSNRTSSLEVDSQIRSRRKKTKNSYSLSGLFFLTFGFSIFLWAYLNAHVVEKWIHSIEFYGLSPAVAESPSPQESSKEIKNKNEDAGKSQEANGQTPPVERAPPASSLEFLVQRQRELEAKSQELGEIEKELEQQRSALDQRIKDLDTMRSKISTILEDRVKVDEQRVEALVQVFTNMKPPQAAKVVETLDEDLVVEILGRMKRKNAAEIMNLLKPEKAQVLAEKYAGFRRSPAGKNATSSEDETKNAQPKDVSKAEPESESK